MTLFGINFKSLTKTDMTHVIPNSQHEIKPNDTQPQSDTFEKTGMSKKKKLAIGAAIVATAAVVIGVLVNKHNRAKALKEIPEEFKTIFKDLKGEKAGENFANKAYNKLKKYMKLEGIAPEKIGHCGRDSGFGVQGGFNPSLNTIEYTDGFFTKLSKADQFSLLAHELKHSEQTSKIIRSGKMDEYAQAWAESNVSAAKGNSMNFSFKIALDKAKKAGEEQEFLDACTTNTKNEILTHMKDSHKETLKLPKFESGSQEYADAEKYIEASRNYEGLGMFGMGTEEYKTNALEKEAYAYGDKMKKFFTTLLENG